MLRVRVWMSAANDSRDSGAGGWEVDDKANEEVGGNVVGITGAMAAEGEVIGGPNISDTRLIGTPVLPGLVWRL
jgi:hypothetical protein